MAPKVIMVGTHMDMMKDEKKLEELREKLTALKSIVPLVDVHFLSSKTKKGVKEFIEKMLDTTLKMPLMKTEVPLSYQLAASKIEAVRGSNAVMTWVEFCSLLVPLNFTSEGSIITLADFLHDVGIIIWFNQAGLKDLVILDPQWLAQIMASVVSFKSAF
jgi:hypothetical protein